ncbi:MAG: hypothetical protein IJV91_03545 [Kiritimatiellae bacterium]|nr:hypothetical protein [Kiritimatiellia bacterium]
MNKDLNKLMSRYAELIRFHVIARNDSELNGTKYDYRFLDQAHGIAGELLREHNVFAQVRGLYHGTGETAVFYAGKRAWEKHMPPFYEIACF